MFVGTEGVLVGNPVYFAPLWSMQPPLPEQNLGQQNSEEPA